jgi:hypothetical protein
MYMCEICHISLFIGEKMADRSIHVDCWTELCGVCTDPLENTAPLPCSHRIHLACLEKHFKPECPICRTPQTVIIPKGIPPKQEPFPPPAPRPTPACLYFRKRVVVVIYNLPIRPNNFLEEDKEYVEQMLTMVYNKESITSADMRALSDASSRIGVFRTSVVDDV